MRRVRDSCIIRIKRVTTFGKGYDRGERVILRDSSFLFWLGFGEPVDY